MTVAKRPEFERRLLLGEQIYFAAIAKQTALSFWIRPNWNDESKSQGSLEFHEKPREGRELTFNWCHLLCGPCCHQHRHSFVWYEKEMFVPLFHYCCELGVGVYDPIWEEIEGVLQRLIAERKANIGGD
jgi:hypothetical protein